MLKVLKKFGKIKFFNKILFIYFLILFFTVSVIVYVASKSISQELLRIELSYSMEIMKRIGKFYEDKYKEAQRIINLMYVGENKGPDLFSGVFPFLKDKESEIYDVYSKTRGDFDRFFYNEMSRNIDIKGIVVYKTLDESIYFFPSSSWSYSLENEQKGINFIKNLDLNETGIHPIPSHLQNYLYPPDMNSAYAFSFATIIKDKVTYSSIGVLVLDYSTDSFKKVYHFDDREILGYILLTDNKGDVIYDSSGRYYGKKYPYYDLITNNNEKADLEEKCIIRKLKLNVSDVHAFVLIPESKLYKRINVLKSFIMLIAAICITVSFIVSIFSIKAFSNRVNDILVAMKKVKKGMLSHRIVIKDKRDEIDEIALSFNDMCHNLEEYIKKVYIAGLKQKNSELKALQAQINPHFLYNTLEAIRMKALSTGDKEAGEMIYILANLLRSGIKDEMVVLIKDEIKYCKMYLELFLLRYADRLKVDFNFDDEVLCYGIVRHMMQPILENYFIHGFNSERLDNNISIEGYKKEEDIIICFCDNGEGIEEEKLEQIRSSLNEKACFSKQSIGIVNVNERIRMIYGEKYGLEINSKKGNGTSVIIKIQAKTKEELKAYVQNTAG